MKTPSNADMVKITLEIRRDQKNSLVELKSQTGESESCLIRAALDEYIKKRKGEK